MGEVSGIEVYIYDRIIKVTAGYYSGEFGSLGQPLKFEFKRINNENKIKETIEYLIRNETRKHHTITHIEDDFTFHYMLKNKIDSTVNIYTKGWRIPKDKVEVSVTEFGIKDYIPEFWRILIDKNDKSNKEICTEAWLEISEKYKVNFNELNFEFF